MFKFLRNLFKKRRVETNTFVPKRHEFENKGLEAVSKLDGVNVQQLGRGEYAISVDMDQCNLSPMEIMQMIIEKQIEGRE